MMIRGFFTAFLMKHSLGRFGLGKAELGSGLFGTLLIMKPSSNIQSYYFLLIGQVRELDRLHKDSIFASRKGHRIRSLLVTFSKIWSLLVTFSAYYLNTPLDYINHLIDKSFNSHQEYTIATSYLAPIRGTTRLCKLLIFKHFTKSCFLYPPNLVTFGHIFSPAEEPGDHMCR